MTIPNFTTHPDPKNQLFAHLGSLENCPLCSGQNFSTILTGRFSAMIEGANKALTELGKTVERVTNQLRDIFNSKATQELIQFQQHAFTPDYDLRCTYPGCDMTPEEH